MSEKAKSQKSVMVPFLLGGLAGAALGLLLARKTGSELRMQIKNAATDTKERFSSTLGKGLDLYDDAKIAVSSAVEAGRQAYTQERQKLQQVQ
ncbi:MAG: hypothetical protein A2010_18560 [Nitrospirae bacterium GWD2_57_9]|nr:MAG: hypothetical protein A2010_18560 [Nitrospirae bacterium GWD2_57_9]OGW48567.1 MAG: hypothetical protein A2078_00435 [Nitrospirae bacterium GWC2_57_9]